MVQPLSILLIILIEYSAYSFGVEIGHKDSARVSLDPREDFTAVCTGEDEVMWDIASPVNYTVRVETPRRKVFQLKNASVNTFAICVCRSKKNESEFVKLTVETDPTRFGYRYPKGGGPPIKVDDERNPSMGPYEL